MCSYLGIPIENSVAAGDAQNDIEMLKAARVGAVMCNAFPGIQEYGDRVFCKHEGRLGWVSSTVLENLVK